jgi:hypothetical protein
VGAWVPGSMRLSRATLQALSRWFGASKAEIIRQLTGQATPDDFPSSWQMKAEERHGQQSRQKAGSNDRG